MPRRDQLARLFAALALVTALLIIGGVPRFAVVAVAALSLIAFLPLVTSRRRFETWPPLLILLGTAAVLTALQLVPLPSGLVDWMSPGTIAIHADAARARGGEVPSLVALTVDPPATMLELCKLVAYLCFAFVALRVSSRRRGRRRLASVVAGVAGAMAVIALVHNALDERKLFGFYEALEYAPPYLAPLINSNHLAGFLAMGACVSLGLALGAHDLKARTIWGCTGALSGGVSLLSGSRGAAIGLLLGVSVTLALAAYARRKDAAKEVTTNKKIHTREWAFIAFGLVIAGAVVAVTATNVTRDLARTRVAELSDPHSKFGAWRSAAGMIPDYPLFGIGRGAFEPAFTREHAPSNERTYSHVENEYLQAVVDWGVVGGLALLLGVCLVIRRIWYSWDHKASSAGALGGVVVLAAHNAVDFSLELPGVALTVICLLAALSREKLTSARPRRAWTARARIAAVPVAALIVIATATPLGRPLRDDRERLERELSAARDEAQITQLADAYMARHPADYLGSALAARALYKHRSRLAFRYVNHALRRHPTHPGAHHLVARMLRAAGLSEQATVEYALALQYSENPRRFITEIAEAYPDPQIGARAFPDLPPRVAVRLMDMLIKHKRPDLVVTWGTRYRKLHPDNAEVLLRIARAAMATEDTRLAAEVAEAVHTRAPTVETAKLVARSWDQLGRQTDADALLRKFAKMSATVHDRSEALQILARRLVTRGELTEAQQILRDLLEVPGLSAENRIQAHKLLAEVERKLGNLHRASWEESRARSLAR